MNYKGYTYTFELDTDGDTVKRIHMVDGMQIDFCPYETMDMETLAMLIDLRAFKRTREMVQPWDKHSVSRFFLTM